MLLQAMVCSLPRASGSANPRPWRRLAAFVLAAACAVAAVQLSAKGWCFGWVLIGQGLPTALRHSCSVSRCRRTVCRSSVALRGVSSHQAPLLWRYNPPEYRMLESRQLPSFDAMRTGNVLEPGEIFAAWRQQHSDDGSGVEFLELANGRGWVFDQAPQVGVLCVRHTGATTWEFSPPEKRPLDLRALPQFASDKSGRSLPPGAVFKVRRELVEDGITFLELESGEGWAFDRVTDVGVLCSRYQDALWKVSDEAKSKAEAENEEKTLPAEWLQPPFPPGSPDLARIPVVELSLGEEFRGYVTGVDYEGAFVDMGAGVDGWVHISQISDTQVFDPSHVLSVGQEVDVWVSQITEDGKFYLSMSRNKLRLRPRSPLMDMLRELQVDSCHEGIVSHVCDHGAFVILGDAKGGIGHEGLVHVSKMPGYVKHASDAAKVRQKVRVQVLSVRNGRLELSMTGVKETFESVPRTQWLDGKIYNIKPFGVFVEVQPPSGGPPVQGLVHLSRIREGFVEDPSQEVQLGDSVKVRVAGVDAKSGKVSFTMLPVGIDK